MQFAALIAVYALISAYGLYKIKIADGMEDSALWLGALAYGVGFLIWMFILRKFPLSIAFPIAAGALIMVTQGLSYALLKEAMTSMHLIGVAMIVAGIGLVYARA